MGGPILTEMKMPAFAGAGVRRLAATKNALSNIEGHAQDGRGVNFAAQTFEEFHNCVAARSRALCALSIRTL